MRTHNREWTIAVPWGHIALASWGDPLKKRVLLVHGKQDSLATFIPLLELLPDEYYFVGLDLPGHGRSLSYPHGVALTRLNLLPAIRYAVEHLQWENFIYMAHSMGTDLGIYYNVIFPGEITKTINLDPGPSLLSLRTRVDPIWYNHYYHTYYGNYKRYNSAPWPYTQERAVQSVQRARNLTEENAALVLTRNLEHLDKDKYVLTLDPRLKCLSTLNLSPRYIIRLLRLHPRPTLTIWATDSLPDDEFAADAKKLLINMTTTLPNYTTIIVEGDHDVHLSHPERVACHVREFLDKDFSDVRAKL